MITVNSGRSNKFGHIFSDRSELDRANVEMAEKVANTKDDILTQYQNDPVGFFEKELGEEKLTGDIIRLLESVRDYPITVVVSATGVGKTWAGGRIANWVYKSWEETKVYLTAASPQSNLQDQLWAECVTSAKEHPDLFENDAISASMRIRRNEKQFITGILIPKQGSDKDKETAFSGKHSPTLVFIVDEGDGVPDAVFKGIDGCMSGGEFMRLVVFFNPKKRSGYVYELIANGRANVVYMTAFDHPNVVTGENVIPGAVDRQKTVQRINDWTREATEDEEFDALAFENTNGELPPKFFRVPEFLVGVVAVNGNNEPYPPLPYGIRRIENIEFYYKVLARYPAEGENQLFPDYLVHGAIDRGRQYEVLRGEVMPGEFLLRMGVDVAGNGVDSNCVCLREGGFVGKFIKFRASDANRAGEKVADYWELHKPDKTYVDGIGVGNGVPSRMRQKGCRHVSAVVVSEKPIRRANQPKFRKLRDQLYWLCAEWLKNDPTAMLPNNERMKKAMAMMTYYEDAKGEVVVSSKDEMKTKLGFSPDELESLILTFAPSGTTFGKV